jgi:hypothetical protein
MQLITKFRKLQTIRFYNIGPCLTKEENKVSAHNYFYKILTTILSSARNLEIDVELGCVQHS